MRTRGGSNQHKLLGVIENAEQAEPIGREYRGGCGWRIRPAQSHPNEQRLDGYTRAVVAPCTQSAQSTARENRATLGISGW